MNQVLEELFREKNGMGVLDSGVKQFTEAIERISRGLEGMKECKQDVEHVVQHREKSKIKGRLCVVHEKMKTD